MAHSSSTRPKPSGTIRALTYRNDDTGYSVARFGLDGAPAVTVVGVMPPLAPGEVAELVGDWTEHPRCDRRRLPAWRAWSVISAAG